MAKIQHQDFTAELQLKGIEILGSSINPPVQVDQNVNFNFNINLETKIVAPNKLIFVIVNIHVIAEDQKTALGSMMVSCIFSIANFEEVVKLDSDNKLNIPDPLAETLNIISISTARGVMFSNFRGTHLHNAYLPIIDPKSFKPQKLNT